MRILSWNVNGLRACANKGFFESMRQSDADIICLQETKLQKRQFDHHIDGYEVFLNCADKPGYSGTAVYTRVKPVGASYGIGVDEHDHEGRVITLELENMFVVCVYTPNSQDGLRRLEYRMRWEDAFRQYVSGLSHKKPLVICGDMNVAREDIDLKNPKTNHMSAGFTDDERAKLEMLIKTGFTDTFRHFYPDAVGRYSWWSYIGNARSRNTGWRIDYCLASDSLTDRLAGADICQDVLGSDHCPVTVDIL